MNLELDDYQAVNLLSALRASGCYQKLSEPNALKVLNSGDWIGELIQELERILKLKPGQSVNDFQSTHFGLMHPNLTPQEYVERANQQFHLEQRDGIATAARDQFAKHLKCGHNLDCVPGRGGRCDVMFEVGSPVIQPTPAAERNAI